MNKLQYEKMVGFLLWVSEVCWKGTKRSRVHTINFGQLRRCCSRPPIFISEEYDTLHKDKFSVSAYFFNSLIESEIGFQNKFFSLSPSFFENRKGILNASQLLCSLSQNSAATRRNICKIHGIPLFHLSSAAVLPYSFEIVNLRLLCCFRSSLPLLRWRRRNNMKEVHQKNRKRRKEGF